MAVPYHTHTFEIPQATKDDVLAGVSTDKAVVPAALGTASTKNIEDFATASQGQNADNAVQPSDLAPVAISGSYPDLINRPTLGTAAAQDSTAFATALQGGKADTAVQPSGLGSAAYQSASSFATSSQGSKADTAIQAPGGATGQVLTKNSGADGDVAWQTVAAATAVSYAPQTLTSPQQTQARDNIGAPSTAIASTSANGLMSSTDKAKINGIAAGAQVNTVTSVAGKTGAVSLTKGDVGLGNVDNTADANKSVSYAASANWSNNANNATNANTVGGRSVQEAVALLGADWVGSYAFLRWGGSTVAAPGVETPGANLSRTDGTGGDWGSPPQGSWRLMSGAGVASNQARLSLWKRIA
ncbi:hypothetical protein ABE527_19010 [Brucella sp. TWI432]